MTTHTAAGHKLARRLRLSAIAAVCIVVTGLALPISVANAADPTPTPTTSVADTTPRLAVTAGTFGSVREGIGARFVIAVQNPSTTPITSGSATIQLGTQQLTDTAAVDAWLSGDSDLLTTPTVSAAIPDVDANSRSEATTTIPVTNSVLERLTPGTYPVLVNYIAGEITASQRTLITVLPLTTAQDVTIVLPITAPAGDRVLLSSDELAALTSQTGDLTLRLDAVLPNTTLAIDPSIPAAIRALGTSAPASATAWLEQLLELPNERFALPFADADLATQVAAGLSSPLEPTSLVSELVVENFPAAPETPAPTASPDETAPETLVPPTDELLDIGAPLVSVAWPRTGSASDEVLAFAGAPSALIADTQLPEATSLITTAADRTVISYNAELASDAAALSATTDEATLAVASAEFVSTVQFASKAAEGQPLAIVLDRTVAGVAPSVDTLFGAVQSSGVTVQPWSVVTGKVSGSATIAPGTVPTVPGASLKRILDDAPDIASLATVLTDPELLTGRERAAVMNLIAASGIDDAAFGGRANAFEDRTTALLDAVGIVPRKSLTIVSKGVNLPVWVRNDLPWPISVTLEARPNDVRLDVQRNTEVEVPAASTSRVFVPVTSGVSNGAATISMQLWTPEHARLGNEERTEVTVRADWETIGLVIIGSLVALLLVFGTIRMIRRRRQDAADEGESRDDARNAFRHPVVAEISDEAEADDTADAQEDPRG